MTDYTWIGVAAAALGVLAALFVVTRSWRMPPDFAKRQEEREALRKRTIELGETRKKKED